MNDAQYKRLERNVRKAKTIKPIRRLTQAQNDWLKLYEGATGFEPMHLEELAAGSMTFNDVARSNIEWYEMHMHDAFHTISDNVPFDQEGTR